LRYSFFYLFISKLLYLISPIFLNTPTRPRQKILEEKKKILEEKTQTHVDKKMKELWNIEKVKQRI
jgi:hypothetical protein